MGTTSVTHTQVTITNAISPIPNPNLDIQSSDDDGETELEPMAIYNVHVMEEIDNCAQEQEWELGEGAV
jgi:hypothetical protein